ncbi:hypothetical protein [Alkalicoccobacillus gibsonii]|uniref:hypothetical protein n=1 Tax=Alkalicoccobacillus gibsonii TaxID=79881 RepID=UPI0035183A25
MYKKLIFVWMICLLILTACGGAENIKSLSDDEIIPVVSQSDMTKAKELVLQMEEVIDVRGIQYEHLLFLDPKVKQFDRLKLEHIRQEAFKRVKDEFPESKVHVTTDQKIYMELEKLEQQLADEKINAKDLKKKLEKLEEDMKG